MSRSGSAALRGAALLVGLCGYGVSMAMMVRAGLGLDPWDVFHQGLAVRTGMTIGAASAVVGVAVLLAWIPLRNRPGIGTVANVIVIAITVDIALWLIPVPTSLPVRVTMMVAAVVLNAFSTVLYIGAGLGPGPRDGLMTGLVVRTGRSVRLVRTTIEVAVLTAGWLLGGSVGIGTVVYAVGIGPLVQVVLRITPRRVLVHSGWAFSDAGSAGPPRLPDLGSEPADREGYEGTADDAADGDSDQREFVGVAVQFHGPRQEFQRPSVGAQEDRDRPVRPFVDSGAVPRPRRAGWPGRLDSGRPGGR